MSASLALAEAAAPSDDGADRVLVAEEEACVARCVAGDAEGYRPLVEKHQRVAFSVALRMLGNRADAEDIVQQSFVDAFEALDRFDGGGRAHAFRAWVLRIVVNRAKDVLKSKKRTESSLEDDVSGGDAFLVQAPPDPEASAEARSERARLERHFAGLPEKYRTALVLKDVEDLSYEEMRSILRLPITTLKIRVVRARAMLRASLEADKESP